MYNKSKKGFTLIEIIVVLLILAILAAAAIPTMNGFIKDAEGKQYTAEARAISVACRMIEIETDSLDDPKFNCANEQKIDRIKELTGIDSFSIKSLYPVPNTLGTYEYYPREGIKNHFVIQRNGSVKLVIVD